MNKISPITNLVDENKTGPRSVSLISSCGCNLNCSYCVINKSVNSFQHQIQENTIKALQDGSFLENVKRVFTTMNYTPGYINTLCLWGQEPTLTLKYLTPHLPEYLDYFFNVNHFEFVTNGMYGASDIVDFIQTIDLNLKHSGNIAIQFSYDGKEQTALSRKGDSETIFNTVKSVITGLNQIQFKRLDKIILHLHSVLSMDMVKRLDTMEKIKSFFDEYENFSKQLCDLNTNAIVHMQMGPSFAMEQPVNASSEDGLNFVRFYKMASKLKTINNEYNNYVYGIDILFKRVYDTLFQKFPYASISEFLDESYPNTQLYQDTVKMLSHFNICGTQNVDLKIMYDGTLISCQNSIYETKEEYLQNYTINDPYDIIEYYSKKNTAKPYHNWCFNPLTEDKDHCMKMKTIYETYRDNGFLMQYNEVINLMFLLAQCHQIDTNYLEDMNKLMRHAFIIAGSQGCIYNNMIKTGSAYTKNAGYLRLLCNGLMDDIEETYIRKSQRIIQGDSHVYKI